MSRVRRVSALALILSLSIIGIPLPAHAGGEESPPLTINGLPLSQVLNRTALGDPIPLAGLLRQETGQISGVVVGPEGEVLTGHTVQVKRITGGSGGGRMELVVGTTTTDAEGRFSFTALEPNDYRVEVLNGDDVIGDTFLTLAAGAMQAGGIRVATGAPGWWGRRSTGAKVGIITGIGLGIFLTTAAILADWVSKRS